MLTISFRIMLSTTTKCRDFNKLLMKQLKRKIAIIQPQIKTPKNTIEIVTESHLSSAVTDILLDIRKYYTTSMSTSRQNMRVLTSPPIVSFKRNRNIRQILSIFKRSNSKLHWRFRSLYSRKDPQMGENSVHCATTCQVNFIQDSKRKHYNFYTRCQLS